MMTTDLRSVPLFAALGSREVQQLLEIAREEKLSRDTVVFFQGDRANALHVILEGAVKIYQTSEAGQEKILATLRRGDVFGELTLLDGQPRSATAATLEETRMLSLEHAAFRELADASPEILWKVIRHLCQRVRDLSEQTLSLAFEDAPQRLLRVLVNRAEEAGRPGMGDTGRSFAADDLGGTAGVDRPTAGRVLRMLAGRDLIELDGDEVRVPDPRRLRRALDYSRDWF